MAHHSVFNAGVEVEVASADHSLGGILFPARIKARLCKGSKFVVEYKSREANGRPLSEEVDMGQLRPLCPPAQVTSFDFGDEVEAFFRGGWWEGVITDVGKGPVYWVYFRSANREFKFQSSELRPHHEWENGTWLPSREELLKTEASSNRARIKEMSNRTVVEVHGDKDGFQGSGFPTKVVNVVGHNKCLIEYQTPRRVDDAGFSREEVDIQHVSSFPPKVVRNVGFNLNEKVDALWDDGRWEGVISKVLNGSRYKVYFSGKKDEAEFPQSDLRPHQDWVDRTWIMASQEEVSLKTKADLSKARMKKFRKGTIVEVHSDDDGFHGSWFAAKVIRAVGHNKYLIEYQTLRTKDDAGFLRKKFDIRHIRPCPPETVRSGGFNLNDKVDAFCNDGWWEGVISKVLRGSRYKVCFLGREDEGEFLQSDLRPHQDWVDGTWIMAPQEVLPETKANSRKSSMRKLRKGTIVEVQPDDDGFEGSWFAAKVVSAVGQNKYLIEYERLRTEDDTGFLKEEVDLQHIRPHPPRAITNDAFNLNDKVDAFCNDGWWEGVISKVLRGSRYKVCFLGREGEGEFLHIDLRPHQDWVDGTWIMAPQEVLPETKANSRKSSMKKLKKGTIVEVQPDDDGFEGSWFAAKIVNAVGQNKYLIEYERLRTEDDTGFLREEVDLQHIRPRPPQAITNDAFNLNEEVDAFYNDGWWEGVISKVLRASRYKVHFPSTGDEVVFPHTDLRPRQRWVDGTWIMASQAMKF